MEPPSPTMTSAIRCPIAWYEGPYIKSSAGSKTPTTAIKVTWELSQSAQLGDGEWSVTWDGMESSETIMSGEGYGCLTQNLCILDDGVLTRGEPPVRDDVIELESLDDGYFEKIFNNRALVQSPAKVLPPTVSASPVSPTFPNKFSVYFLLGSQMAVPTEVTIRFTPTWSSPIMPSPHITVPVTKADGTTNDREIHRLWAKNRLVDLRELQELADELAQTGHRALNTGIMKVGVDGSDHDVERVRWEAEMVGRERNWVLKGFLGALEQDMRKANGANEDGATMLEEEEEELTEHKEIENGLKILEKLAKSLKLETDETDALHPDLPPPPPPAPSLPVAKPAPSRSRSRGREDTEDDLFALPLSPRSPDMAVSPFSMFRGPSMGNLNGILSSNVGQKGPSRSNLTIPTLSKGAIPIESVTPATPTLVGTPNPEEMRRRRVGSPGLIL